MTHPHSFVFTACFALGVFVAPSVYAQTPPAFDAGALMRQTEQNIRHNQLQQAAQRLVALAPEADLNASTLVTVERFKFMGNHKLSTDLLQTVAATYVGQPLNQHDLRRLTDAISQEYRKAGWLVQAYIPRQNLAGPELLIQVVESIPPSKP